MRFGFANMNTGGGSSMPLMAARHSGSSAHGGLNDVTYWRSLMHDDSDNQDTDVLEEHGL